MGIFTGRTVGTIDLGGASADIPIIDTTDAIGVNAFNIKNNSAAGRVIDIYSSPNLISASGTKVATLTLAAGKSGDVGEVIGQNYTDNIIAVADGTDCDATMSYTQYDGDDV